MSIIKSLSVDNGDMFYIKHNSDSFSVIDCYMDEDNREEIVNELKRESCDRTIKRFISTHPDDDHIRGLKYLNQKMPISNFYCVENEVTKEEKTDDFIEYCKLRNSKKTFHLEQGCSRCWLNKDSDERGGAGIHILWPVTSNKHYRNALREAKAGDSPNNISPIIKYSLQDGVNVLWMGDLETDFMEEIEDNVSLEKIDIVFAPHHGRDSGKIPKSWLDALNPKIIVIGEAPSQHLNYYQGFYTIKQNSAGELLFECVENAVHIYVEKPSYSENFLDDENRFGKDGLHYLGTLIL